MTKKENQRKEFEELLQDVIVCEGIEQIPLDNLVIPDYYSREEINEVELLKTEIQLNGFLGALIVNVNDAVGNVIVDGVLRFKICRELGFETIPVRFVKTSSLEKEKRLSIIQNWRITDFSFEDFELNYPTFNPSEYGMDDLGIFSKKSQTVRKNIKSGVLKQAKIMMTAEDCDWVYEQLDSYRKQYDLPGRKEALLHILTQLNLV